MFAWAATFAVALVALNARATYGAQVTSDEPQYLLTALSLAEDADLDISDELSERRFLSFHEVALNTQTIDLDANGQRLSPHDPLLPLLLAPAMGLGGWMAAKATLAALAGLAAAATAWVAVHRFQISPMVATGAAVVAFANPPLTAYATQVYPEMPAALAVVVALGAVLGLDRQGTQAPGDARTGRLQLVAATAVVTLPWLSVKYVPVAAVLALGLVWRVLSDDRKRAARLVTALAVAGAAYLLVHRQVYGGWTVYAAGDHFVDGEFQVIGSNPNYLARSQRLIGLLVDRRFGLIPWAPIFAMLPAGVGFMISRGIGPRRLPLAVLATGWAVATWVALTMHGWWWPGRQLVAVLPLAVIAIASLVDGRPKLIGAATAAGLVGAVNWGWLAIEASTGRRTLIVDFFETEAVPYRLLAPLFPDHIRFAASDVALTAIWTAVVAALAILGWRVGRRSHRHKLIDLTRPPSVDQEARAMAVGSTGGAN